MTPLVTAESSQHWYSVDPETKEIRPEYETPQGTKTTLAVARKQHFLPSVTNVLSVMAKPELEIYKQIQCILSALTLPKMENEPLDDFARRCVKDAGEQSKKARDLGSDIHAAVESYLLDGDMPEPGLAVYVNPFIEWARTHIAEVIGVEQYIADTSLGYAGKYDAYVILRGNSVFDSKQAVLDLKCRTCRDGKPALYWEDSRQLAAYAHALYEGIEIGMVSVIIDTSAPGKFYLHEWTNFYEAWTDFQHCHALWCSRNKYNPGMI